MDSPSSVSLFLFKEDWKILKDSLKDSKREVENFSSVVELLTYMSVQSMSLVIASIRVKEDVIKFAEVLKKAKTTVKNGQYKYVAVNFSGRRDFDIALNKIGIQDVISPSINTKALNHKLEMWFRGLEKKNTAEEKNSFKKEVKNEEKGNSKSLESVNNINWASALNLEDDIWIVKNKAEVKQLLGKWIIKLMGPGPFAGQWNAISNKRDLWRFDLNKEQKEYFLQGDQTWYFQGDQKPDFVWKENLWMFLGKEAYLFYGENEERVFRFRSEKNKLSISENSIVALTKEQLILDTFDQEVLVKSEEGLNLEKSFEEERVLKNLEGEASTTEINSKNLGGEIESLSLDDFQDIMGISKEEKKEENDLSHKVEKRDENELSLKKNKEKEIPFNEKSKGESPAEDSPMELESKSNEVKSLKGKVDIKEDEENKKRERKKSEAPFHESSKKKNGLKEEGEESGDEDKDQEERALLQKGKKEIEKEREEISRKALEEKKDKKQQEEREKKEKSLHLKDKKDGEEVKDKAKLPKKREENTEEQEREDLQKRKLKENKNRELKKHQEKNGTEFNEEESEESEIEEKRVSSFLKKEQLKKGEKSKDKTPKGSDLKKSTSLQEEDNFSPQALEEESGEGEWKKGSNKAPEFNEGGKSDDPRRGVLLALKTDKSDQYVEKYLRHKKFNLIQKKKKKTEDFLRPSQDVKKNIQKELAREQAQSEDDREEELSEEKIEKIIEAGEMLETGKFVLKMNYQGFEFEAKFVDLFDRTLVFQSEDGELQINDELILDLKLIYLKKDYPLKLRGVISQVDMINPQKFEYTFEIKECDELEFARFLRIVNLRQRNIDLFFKYAYGT